MLELSKKRRRALGYNVNRQMDNRRMSFRACAKAVGMSTTGLFQIVDGTGNPRAATLFAIADLFGMSIDDLFVLRPSTEKPE